MGTLQQRQRTRHTQIAMRTQKKTTTTEERTRRTKLAAIPQTEEAFTKRGRQTQNNHTHKKTHKGNTQTNQNLKRSEPSNTKQRDKRRTELQQFWDRRDVADEGGAGDTAFR